MMGSQAKIKELRRALAQTNVWMHFEPFVVKSSEEVPTGREWLGENKYRILDEVFRIYHNNLYSVLVGEPVRHSVTGVYIIHLSIKRHDREAIHDWRHLQRIKNELVGPENEAIELYPAESRLLDTSNQYHLWVLADPILKMPFGYDCDRSVSNEANWPSAQQRPL